MAWPWPIFFAQPVSTHNRVRCLDMPFEYRSTAGRRLLFFGAVMKMLLRLWPVWLLGAGTAWICFWVNKQDLYIWSMVFAGLAIVCALPLYRIRQPWLVYACICMTSLFATLSVGELYLTRGASKSEYVPLSQHAQPPAPGVAECLSNIQPDPLLGYGPKPEQSPDQLHCGPSVMSPVYDIIVPHPGAAAGASRPQRGDKARTAVHLFRRLLVYLPADGLRDRAVYPYPRGWALGKMPTDRSTSACGLGTPQMLALIESGRLDDILSATKKCMSFLFDRSE